MRRADRLFQIIQILRRKRSAPTTAREIAEELEVSTRTIYRDIATLVGQRVPVRGEASFGYVLEGGFDLPPLMLTAEEVEAAALGAEWVAAVGDAALATAALDVIAKIAAILPTELNSYVGRPATGTLAPREVSSSVRGIDLKRAREAIRANTKIKIKYRDQGGKENQDHMAGNNRLFWRFMSAGGVVRAKVRISPFPL